MNFMENSKSNIVEPIDFTLLSDKYEEKWVVLSVQDKEVIKSGNSINDLSEYLDKGIVVYVPNTKYTFSPVNL